jgi:hypothetical protein
VQNPGVSEIHSRKNRAPWVSRKNRNSRAADRHEANGIHRAQGSEAFCALSGDTAVSVFVDHQPSYLQTLTEQRT